MEEQIREALTRVYYHPENSQKELDATLLNAMTQELMELFTECRIITVGDEP